MVLKHLLQQTPSMENLNWKCPQETTQPTFELNNSCHSHIDPSADPCLQNSNALLFMLITVVVLELLSLSDRFVTFNLRSYKHIHFTLQRLFCRGRKMRKVTPDTNRIRVITAVTS